MRRFDDAALVAFVEEFEKVEDALAAAQHVDDALAAVEQSIDVFAEHSDRLRAAGDAPYDTASEIFLEFRRRAYARVAVL